MGKHFNLSVYLQDPSSTTLAAQVQAALAMGFQPTNDEVPGARPLFALSCTVSILQCHDACLAAASVSIAKPRMMSQQPTSACSYHSTNS